MRSKEEIISYLKDIKNGKVKLSLDILNRAGEKVGTLKPVLHSQIINNSEIVKLITNWRDYYKENFFTQFKVTEEKTKDWLKNQVLEKDNRIFFLIENIDGKLVGHEGIILLEEKNLTAELDNVIKAPECKIPGIMTQATKTLLNWLFNFLEIERAIVRLFSDNRRALALYERCGFYRVKEVGLRKEIEGETIKYIQINEGDINIPDKMMLIMELKREDFNRTVIKNYS